MLGPVHLEQFDNSWYRPGRSFTWQVAWFTFGSPLVRLSWIPWSGFRTALLRLFGAEIGTGVVIKPGVQVKYPWRLTVGDHCWIGEDAWIDNLTTVSLASNVCISQGAYLCTGNHDWTDPSFGLVIEPITLDNGSWVGARAVLAPGVVLGECAIAAAGSVVTRSIPAYEIHAGNPAKFVRQRRVKEPVHSQQAAL